MLNNAALKFWRDFNPSIPQNHDKILFGKLI